MHNDFPQQTWQTENTKNRKTEPTIQMATPTAATNRIPMTKATTSPETTTKTGTRTTSHKQQQRWRNSRQQR